MFEWQNSLKREQVSSQHSFPGSFIQALIQSAGERECRKNLAGFIKWRVHVVFCCAFSQGQGEASARGTTMEGDCLSCIKYLMFVFNFLIFVSIAPLFLKDTLSVRL